MNLFTKYFKVLYRSASGTWTGTYFMAVIKFEL